MTAGNLTPTDAMPTSRVDRLIEGLRLLQQFDSSLTLGSDRQGVYTESKPELPEQAERRLLSYGWCFDPKDGWRIDLE